MLVVYIKIPNFVHFIDLFNKRPLAFLSSYLSNLFLTSFFPLMHSNTTKKTELFPSKLNMAIDYVTNIKPSMSNPPNNEELPQNHDNPKQLVFDSSLLKYQSSIPKQFIWPDEEKPCPKVPEFHVTLIDLRGFLSGDPFASMEASKLVSQACEKHGFFLVVNHGVDEKLIANAHNYMDYFFELPLSEKQRALRKVGEHCGYASSFTGRFSSKLPWKETLSFQYSANKNHSSSTIVQDYLHNVMGEDFLQFGYVSFGFLCSLIYC